MLTILNTVLHVQWNLRITDTLGARVLSFVGRLSLSQRLPLKLTINSVRRSHVGKVNRGAGYGLEIPCVYRLYGPKVYTDRMKQLTDSLRAAELM